MDLSEPVDGTATANADNTRRNIQDYHLGALTPRDQSNDRIDRAITQDIRKMLVKNKKFIGQRKKHQSHRAKTDHDSEGAGGANSREISGWAKRIDCAEPAK